MKQGLKWGVFSLSQYPDQSIRVEGLEADMKLFELAEALGYDTVWLAEHLFSTYGIVTSTQVLAAAVAQRIKRMRIGTAVVVLPFNHPLRHSRRQHLGRGDDAVGREQMLCHPRRVVAQRLGQLEQLQVGLKPIDPVHLVRVLAEAEHAPFQAVTHPASLLSAALVERFIARA